MHGHPLCELSSRAERGTCFRWDHHGLHGFHRCSPVLGHIFPCRVVALDQSNTLCTRLALNLLLPGDRISDVLELLVINQPIDLVLLREPFDFSSLVLQRRSQSFNICRAITSRWISLVPSPMVHSFTSR